MRVSNGRAGLLSLIVGFEFVWTRVCVYRPSKSTSPEHMWSRGVARWLRRSLSVADSFVCRCHTSSAMLPFPHPAHRTGRADLPHPALGEDSRNRRGHLHVTSSATSENTWGVLRLIANLPFYRRFLRPPSIEASSLRRSYRLRQYYEPLRHPSQPGRSLTSCQGNHSLRDAGGEMTQEYHWRTRHM